MNPEMLFHLRSLTRFIYYVTEEEDRTLKQLAEVLKKHEQRTFVFNPIFGLIPLTQLLSDWETHAHAENRDVPDMNRALIRIYQNDPRDEQDFYIFQDPERYLVDPQVQRRFLNLAHQLHNDEKTVKVCIFVGHRAVIPPKLQRYFEVVHDRGPNAKEIREVVEVVAQKTQVRHKPHNVENLFRGLTTYEIDAAVIQSVVHTKKDKENPRRIDPTIVNDFRRRQLRKTDLIQYIDTSKFTLEQIGGLERFKAWIEETKACWTPEGQKAGLEPPRGILAVGVWGCGKSISVKALGVAWRLPVIQLQMGKLRSSGVGDTEANVLRALHLVEAVSPCILWVDEAEKDMAGTHSSSRTDAGTTSRTVGMISTWMQETEAPVCTAMTANSLETLPVEFINRMDERFFFDMPSEDERIEILKIHLRAKGQDPAKFQLRELADASKKMVGREIEQSVKAALRRSFHEGFEGLDSGVLLRQLQTKPRIYRTMADELSTLLSWVGYDPDVKDGIRARFASEQRSETFHEFQVSEGGDDGG